MKNYLFLKNYVTSEWAILCYQQLAVAQNKVRFYALIYFE